ncbi:MAG: glycosyltransferase family 2 protein, partial [Dehalococcoidia bacterium]|nr:glycosyltransferase family 2 protein [Dehalococcoidia bacterium]
MVAGSHSRGWYNGRTASASLLKRMDTNSRGEKPTVVIVIPALNEVSTIGAVLDEIPVAELTAAGYRVRTLVVDNGSTDGTSAVASQRSAEVIIEPQRGKGMAMRRAFREAGGDYVFMLDADATYPAAHIPEMLQKLTHGCDVVTGSRLKGRRAPGSISAVNLLGNYLLTWLGCVLYHRRISDLCTGYWGFRAGVLPCLSLHSKGFNLEAELFA